MKTQNSFNLFLRTSLELKSNSIFSFGFEEEAWKKGVAKGFNWSMAVHMMLEGAEIPFITRYLNLTVEQAKEIEAIKKEIDKKAS